jgi:two-component system phosphate regulon sensor histidine kinase PhoR
MRHASRVRTLAAVFAVAALSLLVGAILVSISLRGQTYARIEASLVSEARVLGELVLHDATLSDPSEIAQKARTLGEGTQARVTFVAADGQVIGDSAIEPRDLGTLANHNDRPEIIEARRSGIGSSRRFSQTLRTEMLYVALRTDHPRISIVRVALPLTEIDQQLRTVRRATLVAAGVALLAAFGLAWIASVLLGRRIDAIAAAAERYSRGDLSQPTHDYPRDEIGTVARVLDETVKALAERASDFARDRARMEAILTGMTEGVLAINAQGRVQLVNRAARQMLAVDDGAVGRHYLEAVRHPGVVEQLGAALAGEKPAVLEMVPARNPDRRVVARAAAVDAPGETGAVLVLYDITDLRRADQVRRDFVANVSHELRTPLTAIRGYVEALADEPLDPGERQRFLAIIERHASRMERLVRDLLRLAGLDAHQEAVERVECNVSALLEGAAADLAAMVAAKGQTVRVQVDPALGPIRTDPAKLQDAVRNLLENAVSYSPDGSTVVLGGTAENGRVILTVSDQGPGIPEADLVRIFERFYRVDKARSRDSGGTGLGLSIVKHLVELLGGTVWAANQSEGGAVFSIGLPRGQERPAA